MDQTGKVAGRGVYLHNRRPCWQQGLKGSIAHALRVELTPQDLEALRLFMNSLPEEVPEEPGATPQD